MAGLMAFVPLGACPSRLIAGRAAARHPHSAMPSDSERPQAEGYVVQMDRVSVVEAGLLRDLGPVVRGGLQFVLASRVRESSINGSIPTARTTKSMSS